MSDKELLEAAARAHGGLAYVEDMGWIHQAPDGSRGAWWHPLTDDGDALRLAVKLNIDVRQCEPALSANPRSAVYAKAPGAPGWIESYNGDSYAATRRAIVRAASSLPTGRGK